jgi:hypothetical protein
MSPPATYPKMASETITVGTIRRLVPLRYVRPHPRAGELVIFGSAQDEKAFVRTSAAPVVHHMLLDGSHAVADFGFYGSFFRLRWGFVDWKKIRQFFMEKE